MPSPEVTQPREVCCKVPAQLYCDMLAVCRNVLRDCDRWQKVVQPDTLELCKKILNQQ